MAIKQLPNGKWLASYSRRPEVPGKPVTLRRIYATKAEAQRNLATLIIDVNDKLKRRLVPTWDELLDQYIESKKGELEVKTVYSLKKCLNKYIGMLGTKRVDEFSRPAMDKLFEEAFQDNTLAHKQYISRNFRAVFEFAIRRGYIKENPTPMIKFKITRKLQAVLTETQAGLLLDKARTSEFEWYPIWATAVYSGMRSGELYALRWSNVNIDLRQIKVAEAWDSKAGFKDYTKNKEDRIVEIPEALVPVLLDLKAQNAWGDYVLPRLRSWDRGEQAKVLRCFLSAIGLHDVRFHDLRATWATTLLSKGVEPIKVMSMGGWKDLETLMIYVRKSGIDIKGSAAKLRFHDHNQQSADVIPIRM